MDYNATLAYPQAVVFDRVSAPTHLGDWLAEVVRVAAACAAPPGIGTTFTLTLRREGTDLPASGEVIAYEPPWLVAYRLFVGERIHVLRITCSAIVGDGTQLQLHQGDGRGPLAVDLARLERALADAH